MKYCSGLLVLAVAAVQNVAADRQDDFNTLRATLKQSLQMNDPSDVCFTTPPVQGVGMFTSGDGKTSTVYGESVQDCSHQFPTCSKFTSNVDNPAGPGYQCRELSAWTVPAAPTPAPVGSGGGSGNSVVCPVQTGIYSACQCQSSTEFSSDPSITFAFTYSQSFCCCSCKGDPHCSSFSGTTASYVPCESARDPSSCILDQQRCQTATWTDVNNNKQSCLWKTSGKYDAVCLPQGPVAPSMNMYTKTYNGNTKFSITLLLGNLGDIIGITVVDGSITETLSTSMSQSTITNTINNWGTVGHFPSQVVIVVEFISPNSKLNQRFHVDSVFDPTLSSLTSNNLSGFCPTGTIAENHDAPLQCTPSDLYILKALNNGVGQPAGIPGGKRAWCTTNFPTSLAQCQTTPWYLSICLIATKLPYSAIQSTPYPLLFQECIDALVDYPAEVVYPDPSVPSFQQLPCTPWSYNSQNAPLAGQYLYIEKQALGGSGYTSLVSIGSNSLRCGLSFSTGDASITGPGNYRILQCQQASTGCVQNGKMTATVTYQAGTDTGVLLSNPYGTMVANGNYICNFPNCPINMNAKGTVVPPSESQYYRCCQYPIPSVGFTQCLEEYHPTFVKTFTTLWPNCKNQ